MTFTLKTGSKLELPDLPAVDAAIDQFEAELARLRRLRKVVAEMTGVPAKAKKKDDDEEDDESPANGKTPTTAAEAGK